VKKEGHLQIRVYYEDTDCGNVVYYANYLRYMERSRTEFLRERGIALVNYKSQNIQFAVVDAHVKYRCSARYDDLLEVRSRLVEHSSVSISFETTIVNQHGQLCTTGLVKLACIGAQGKARRIPEEILASLQSSGCEA
jgi:acyl-CoA thioester hydrolase